MASIRQRHNKFEARVRVPKAIVEAYGGKELLYRTLDATDRPSAKLEAAAWEVALKAEWQVRLSGAQPSPSLRRIYESFREMARGGHYGEADYPDSFDEREGGIDLALDRMADEIGPRDLTPEEQAKVWALNDARSELRGRKPVQRVELEPNFSDIAEEHLRLWKGKAGLKDTNTENQKRATFDLFALYFGERPIRQVTRRDAATFVDALRQLGPNWGRTGKARGEGTPTSWTELQAEHGGRARGLSDNTVNRHVATLSALWRWAEEREYCEGRNPFDGHRRRLQEGRNKRMYVAWTDEELAALFAPPPKRDDLTEIMLVAMYTGMRLNEIASLTNGQVMERDGIQLIDIIDAKTPAGVRQVPLHPRLQWLADRAGKGNAVERIWPRLRNEGPGAKPSGDIGKEFSRYKKSRGFADRKVFHSFRKNVVGQLERAGIPQNEVAQIVGHEKQGLTFGVYGTKAEFERLAEIVALIDYPGLILPMPHTD